MKSQLITMRRRSERGNAMIELGLAAPMMFLILSGVIDFGRAFYFTDLAVSAARAGAQYGIESPANVGNDAAMRLAAYNDANATCTDANGNSATCGTTGSQGKIGSNLSFSATASHYCVPVDCTTAVAKGYVKVLTSITYNLLVPWPGLPNPLNIGGAAILRTQ